MPSNNVKAKLMSIVTAFALATSSFGVTMTSIAFADDTENTSVLEELEEPEGLDGTPSAESDNADDEPSGTEGTETKDSIDDAEVPDDTETDEGTNTVPDTMEPGDEAVLPDEISNIEDEELPEADEELNAIAISDGITWKTVVNNQGISGTCEWGIDGTTLYLRPINGAETGTLPPLTFDAMKARELEPWFYKTSITKFVIAPGVKGTGQCSMFAGLRNLTEIEGLENLDTSNVTSFECMFVDCDSLRSITLPAWNTSKLESVYEMFEGCDSLTSIDISKLDTSHVENMFGMFHACSSLRAIDLSSLNTSSALTMAYMFYQCGALESVIWPRDLDTSNLLYTYCMFRDCKRLKSLDLSMFDTQNVTHMMQMFENCSSLQSLDLSSFDTSNVTNMESMFYNCSTLPSLDVSSFNTKNVKNMDKMFYMCRNLTTLDLTSFDTVSVTSMNSMFAYSSALETLYLSSFDTTNVASMKNMFLYCSNLETVYVGDHESKLVEQLPKKTWYDEQGNPYDSIPTDQEGAFTTITPEVKLSQHEVAVKKGTTSITLSADLSPDSIKGPVTWSSSNEDVATVDSNGNVSIKGEIGSAVITAKLTDEFQGTCTLYVQPNTVKLNETLINVPMGSDPFTLVAEVDPPVTASAITWTSSAPSVAEVDQNGEVTIKKGGTTTITANVAGATESCTVNVISVSLSPHTKTINLNSSANSNIFPLKATITNLGEVQSNTVWSSDAPDIASVDQSGKVTAHSAGIAKIKAEFAGAIDICEVTVLEIKLSETSKAVRPGSEPFILSATILPESYAGNATWTSNKTKIATTDDSVDDTTLSTISGNTACKVIVGKSTGTANIKVNVKVGTSTLSSTCVLTVTNGPIITMDSTEKTVGLDSDPFILVASVDPEDLADQVSWSSSDPDVASIATNSARIARAAGSTSCTVTVHKAGSTEIAAEIEGVKAVCALNVEALPDTPPGGPGIPEDPFEFDEDEPNAGGSTESGDGPGAPQGPTGDPGASDVPEEDAPDSSSAPEGDSDDSSADESAGSNAARETPQRSEGNSSPSGTPGGENAPDTNGFIAKKGALTQSGDDYTARLVSASVALFAAGILFLAARQRFSRQDGRG